jgi:hypothetical protein
VPKRKDAKSESGDADESVDVSEDNFQPIDEASLREVSRF